MSARAVLSFCRDLEFATEDELEKRMGCDARLWPRAVVKELCDNALDACEEVGIDPEIGVDIDPESGTILVCDNGPGIPAETVTLLCDRTLRTSTRQAYAAIDRGCQGNFLQTGMCLPLGAGEDDTTVRIWSRGILHTIELGVDRVAGSIKVDHQREPVDFPETGTIVELPWTDHAGVGEIVASDIENIASLVRSFAALNPHAYFRFGAEAEGQDVSFEVSARGNITKWRGALTPAHWYPVDRLSDRIRQELRRNPSITLAQFLEGFAGLSSRTKRAEIARAMDLSAARLDMFLTAAGTDVDRDQVDALLQLMREASRAPKPASLGAVGKDEIAGLLIADHGSECLPDFAYHTVGGGDIPWRWEIAFAPTGGEELDLRLGRNFSPLVDESGFRYSINLPHQMHRGAPAFLFLHRISPDRPFSDYGKSRLSLDLDERRALEQAIRKVAGKWLAEQEKDKRERERDARREAARAAERRRAELEADAEARRGTLALPIRRRGAKSDEQREREEADIRAWCDGIIALSRQIGLEVGTRGWCYLLEEHGLDKNDFDKAERLITECRKSGLLPLDIVAEENNRVFHGLEEIDYSDPLVEAKNIVGGLKHRHLSYRPCSFWEDQDHYIQMLGEKIELRSLFKPVCGEFFIPIANGRGWSDLNCRASMMRRFQEWEAKSRQCVLLYCGDHDPTGFLISDRLRSNMEELSKAVGWSPKNLIIDRFGLNADQIERLGLTWIDGLSTGNPNTPNLENPRHPDHNKAYVQSYLKQFGPRKVEASALVTRRDEARQLCRDAITRYLSEDAPRQHAEKIKPLREKLHEEIVRLMSEAKP